MGSTIPSLVSDDRGERNPFPFPGFGGSGYTVGAPLPFLQVILKFSIIKRASIY
ncbi:hypothetical protein GCK32_022643 [Trichostrongylus colubriformis]|uniref:Uncharacterized protein n=1 Tax=Trichostrongylus colubriformis TaxID=6319 RepID=A0AAN8G0I7_TRICO